MNPLTHAIMVVLSDRTVLGVSLGSDVIAAALVEEVGVDDAIAISGDEYDG